MNNDDRLKKLVDAAKNEKPLFSIDDIENSIDQEFAPNKRFKLLKTIALMSLLFIISTILFFNFHGAEKTRTSQNETPFENNDEIKEKIATVNTENHIDGKEESNTPEKIINTVDSHKNRVVYNVIDYKPNVPEPRVYSGLNNNITNPKVDKPILEDYFPELTEEEWAKLNMTVTWRKLKYFIEEGDSAVQQFEISSNYGSYVRRRSGIFSNTEQERFLPLGISKSDGSRFLNFTMDAHEIMDSLKDHNQIFAIKTKTINNVVVWYKINEHIAKVLPSEVAHKIAKNTLQYKVTFDGNNENKLNEPSKPLTIPKPIKSKSRTYRVNVSRDEIDSSLIKDSICYNSKLAITPDETTLNRLGVKVLNNGIDLNGHVYGGKISLKIMGGESHSLRHNMKPGGKSKGFAPIYVSGIYDNKHIYGLMPSWYYGTNNSYKHFLEKRHNYLPVLVHTPGNDSTLVLWYEPSFRLFRKLGYEPSKQMELMNKFINHETGKNSKVKIQNAELKFSENPKSGNREIKLLELDKGSLANLSIFTDKNKIHYFLKNFKYTLSEKGASMTVSSKNVKNLEEFRNHEDLKSITIFFKQPLQLINDTSVTLRPKYITDDLGKVWRMACLPEGVNYETTNRISIMDSTIRVDLSKKHLIPVLVKTEGNYSLLDKTLGRHRPDCIFWYEPTEEFLNHLPDSIAKGIRAEIEHMVYTDIIYQAKEDSIIVEKAKAEIIRNENENPEQCNYFEACMDQTLTVSEFKVYPNPVKELLFVNVESSESCQGALIITDIKGRQLAETQINIEEGTNSFSIPVTELNEGIVLLTLTTNKGDLKTQRIIKVN